MKKKTFERMQKKVHEINEGPLSSPIIIQKLKPLEQQPNYNRIMREYHGPQEWEIVVEATGIIDAFKQSEEWREIGTISVHDYKLTINDNLNLVLDDISNYQVKRLDNNKIYEIIFYREFIGEVHVGLRPVTTNA